LHFFHVIILVVLALLNFCKMLAKTRAADEKKFLPRKLAAAAVVLLS
jgi:hypothetical protein